MTLETVTTKQGKQPITGPSAQPPEESMAMDSSSAKSEQQHGSAQKQRSQKQGEFTAIARLHGALIVEGDKLVLVATNDGARFPVQAVRPGALTLKLLTLNPAARIGLFGFWPTSKGDIILSTFHHITTTSIAGLLILTLQGPMS